MNRKILLWMTSLVCLFLASCDDDDKQSFEVVSLSGLVSESGPGNVLLKWDKIESDGVAYVEIVYASGDEAEKKILVNGQYSEKLIYGFANQETYTFSVSVRMEDGQKSSAQTVEAAPARPAFIDLQNTIKVSNSFLGGIDLKWNNLSDDKFYINVEYTNADGSSRLLEVDVIDRGEGQQFLKITGVLSADMNISVSDIVGNTSIADIFKFKILERGKFDRSIWRIPDFSSHFRNSATWHPSKLLDGSKTGFWHSAQGFPQHITFDLIRKVKITIIEISAFAHQISTKDIIIYGSNESHLGPWTEIVEITMPTYRDATVVTDLEEPVEYRYVKMGLITGGSYSGGLFASLSEFVLYGEDIIE